MPEPIDYARAESVDVVRKKFRRRVVMFVIATVVVMVIGIGWKTSGNQARFFWGDARFNRPFSVCSHRGWIQMWGPSRTTPLLNVNGPISKSYGSESIGIGITELNVVGSGKWVATIRYRTLFLLTTIPWLITLIRMFRMWKRGRVLSAES